MSFNGSKPNTNLSGDTTTTTASHYNTFLFNFFKIKWIVSGVKTSPAALKHINVSLNKHLHTTTRCKHKHKHKQTRAGFISDPHQQKLFIAYLLRPDSAGVVSSFCPLLRCFYYFYLESGTWREKWNMSPVGIFRFI